MSSRSCSIAGRVLAALCEPLLVEGQVIQVTATIGVAVPAPTGTALTVLLRQADKALYEAKAEGKARLRLYAPPLNLVPVPRDRPVALREA
jgi:GGDEF domain-containing protein